MALCAAAWLGWTAPAGAHASSDPVSAVAGATTSTTAAAGTTTTNKLPGTTLEAAQRDDGNTSAAPWVIGSAIAAAVSIAVGGTILKRQQR